MNGHNLRASQLYAGCPESLHGLCTARRASAIHRAVDNFVSRKGIQKRV